MSKCLIGKTIQKIKIADDKKAILFITDNEEIIVRVDGDCCSSTWVENIELPVNGFPALVTEMGRLEMPESDNGGELDGNVIAYYGYKITTDKGDIIIDYRNESNGYYGGDLSFPDDTHYYGGVYGQNVSTLNWVEINNG